MCIRDSPDTIHEEVVGDSQISDATSGLPTTNKRHEPQKRAKNENDKLISILKKKNASDEKLSSEIDEDKIFLFSLLSEIKKVPAE